MDKNVFGGMLGFTLIYEENWIGGIGFWEFLCFWAGSRVGLGRRGVTMCFPRVLGEFKLLLVLVGFVRGLWAAKRCYTL
jgi:hypothetical protein